jgi:CheY-like chemotaxis protein
MPAPALQSHGRTVLLVEDDALLRSLLEQALVDAGYPVCTAADGQQALVIARTLGGRIGLVVTDILMPEMDGIELAGHLADLDPAPPVLFISGFVSDRRRIPGPLLEKPFRAGQLLDRVARMLPLPAKV